MPTLGADTVGMLGPGVAVPTYDRGAITASIVHLGVGNFHRAHQAMYVDRLLRAGETGWGICGVGVLPGDASMRDALGAQDGLYTLSTAAPNGVRRTRVIGSIVDYRFAPDDPPAVVARLAAPATRIVSLTITEGGYGVDDATGAFAPTDESTLADLGGRAVPRSALGLLVAALAQRRDGGVAPFTVMSCDNIQGNGDVARAALTGFAGHRDVALGEWIASEVAFPSSMVDRITPATTGAVRDDVALQLGVGDRWPVRAESFTQWVLEDRFPSGRPPFDTVGVQLVDDVEPYELMKLRLLNASHQAMCHLGLLDGATFVHEVCGDPVYREFLLGYMRDEARPTLRPVPGVDLDRYCAELLDRFTNEVIADTLVRLTVDGSDRIPKFLLPVVRERLAIGGRIDHAALVLAAWSRFVEGATAVAVIDRRLDELRAAAAAERERPGAFLDLRSVFGDLGSSDRLREEFVAARADLLDVGPRRAMMRTLRR